LERGLKIIDELLDRLLPPLCAGSDVGGGGDDGVSDDVSGLPPVHVVEDVGLQTTAALLQLLPADDMPGP
jgi:uncharacterized membrane protein YqaE (UPF0057 family)